MSSEKKRIKEQMLINQAVASVKKQLAALDASRTRYIKAATTARELGIASQYALAKNAIRIVTAQKTVVEQMLLNLQISSQIRDVSEMTKSFADGMKILSGAIVDTTESMDFEKVSRQMTNAMVSTQMKQAESDAFMEATAAGFEGFASGVSSTGGDEIDRIIESQMSGGGIDDEIAELERRIKASGNVSDDV